MVGPGGGYLAPIEKGTQMKAIITKYHGPTNTRGGRLTASDGDHNRISLPYDHELNSEYNHDKAAKAICIRMGWTHEPLMRGSFPDHNVYVFDSHSNRVRFTDDERNAGQEMAQKARLARMAKHAEVK